MTYEELAELLCGLPWGEGGVPKPLAAVLVPPRARQRLIAGEPPGRLEFLLLAALGISGWSARLDLVQALNGDRGLQPRSGSYRRAVGRLDESGLWVTHIASFGYRKIALVRLSERGAGLLQEAGVAVVASEWERAEQAHASRGDAGRGGEHGMTLHTAAICTFLHHARLRGYTTEACPAVGDPATRPRRMPPSHGSRCPSTPRCSATAARRTARRRSGATRSACKGSWRSAP